MSNLDILKRAIAGRRAGTKITVDQVRVELEAAQIPPTQYGGLFAAACQKRLLQPTGETRPSLYRPAKGRRVLVYAVAPRRRS